MHRIGVGKDSVLCTQLHKYLQNMMVYLSDQPIYQDGNKITKNDGIVGKNQPVLDMQEGNDINKFNDKLNFQNIQHSLGILEAQQRQFDQFNIMDNVEMKDGDKNARNMNIMCEIYFLNGLMTYIIMEYISILENKYAPKVNGAMTQVEKGGIYPTYIPYSQIKDYIGPLQQCLHDLNNRILDRKYPNARTQDPFNQMQFAEQKLQEQELQKTSNKSKGRRKK